MKTRTKALLLTVCAVLLVAATVFTTVAYLTSKDAVTNTFTVGKVAITLDEAQVNEYGIAVTPATRVKENTYKLIPGHTYTKDPTVHFAAGSEASYLFVKVENGLSAIEAGQTIEAQISANGWTKLESETGVYYKEVEASATTVDYKVFENFEIGENAAVSDYGTAKITVTAYAIQADGFDTAAAAWAEAQ